MTTWLSLLSLCSFIRKVTEMEVLAISLVVRGFHVYKDIWKPSIGDKFPHEREFDKCLMTTYLPSKLSSTEK